MSAGGYVTLNINGKIEYLHRAIMGLTPGDKRQVDHIDRDKRNNRTSNLRIVSQRENRTSKPPGKHNKTGLKGVVKTRNGRYQASLKVEGRRYHVGTFATKLEAGLACDRCVISKVAGGYLNFPNHVTNTLIRN